jgi:putative flippase GtrA
LGLNYVVANVMTIAACSALNFLISDRIVFQV